jgi:uncharacterized protein (TIGR03437 family)
MDNPEMNADNIANSVEICSVKRTKGKAMRNIQRRGIGLWAWLAIVAAAQVGFSQTQPHAIRRGEFAVEFKPRPAREGFTSEAIRIPIERAEPFLAAGVVWTAEAGEARISLRGSADGRQWSEWRRVTPDHDSATAAGESVGALSLFDSRTQFVQYWLESSGVTRLRLVFISPGTTPDAMRAAISERAQQTMSEQPSTKYPKPPVITRTEWGCPDGQVTTHGTLSYTTVTHLIVHHTATGNTAADWPAVIRSIWNFHIFTNGWADIGYNYLVDPNGVIYEGRAGGDNVLGAHFSGVNGGTMGVSMLGTFTDVTPTAAAMASLKKILAWKADQRGIDPAAASLHAASGRTLNNISGHRDGPSPTECPGNALYPLLPALRTDVRALLAARGAAASVSAASFKPGPLAPESIAAVFGTDLASASQAAAAGASLPSALAGTSVSVRDSANNEKLAPLFFVSPGQINLLVPSGLAAGAASVAVTNADGRIAAGAVTIAPVAPALFAANANGRDVAAALVLRIKADGSQVYEKVATLDAAEGKYVPVPIDLGAESDQVFLVAYGTGCRGRSALSAVTAKIGGLNSEVLFAGAVAGLFGLDQVNIRLSRALAGRGDVDLELSMDGVAANVLKLRIK